MLRQVTVAVCEVVHTVDLKDAPAINEKPRPMGVGRGFSRVYPGGVRLTDNRFRDPERMKFC
jgi:hypothetical protein